ncbi:hypothetical protein D3C78_1420290 [compost metagenome]
MRSVPDRRTTSSVAASMLAMVSSDRRLGFTAPPATVGLPSFCEGFLTVAAALSALAGVFLAASASSGFSGMAARFDIETDPP